MTPAALMKIGATVTLVGFVGLFAPSDNAVTAGMLMAMGGAVFGKGYGVWEERNK